MFREVDDAKAEVLIAKKRDPDSGSDCRFSVNDVRFMKDGLPGIKASAAHRISEIRPIAKCQLSCTSLQFECRVTVQQFSQFPELI